MKNDLDIKDPDLVQPINNASRGGPPDGFSAINPVFFNTVVAFVNLLKTKKALLFGKLKRVTPSDKADAKVVSNPQVGSLPKATQGAEVQDTPKKRVNKNSIKKLAVVIFVLFVVTGLIYTGTKLFDNITEEQVGGNTEIVNTPGDPTPTPSDTKPSVPSVYNDDEILNQLEKDMLILDQELTTSVLKESSLDLPILDFNISF
ncbi:hypothetical protein IPM62_02520 [Candidatus Woesebacteria bacterium]|nr:MAG: hypothetical protein IPM62_02520 [Candidatus Woesebacteria bacterium]